MEAAQRIRRRSGSAMPNQSGFIIENPEGLRISGISGHKRPGMPQEERLLERCQYCLLDNTRLFQNHQKVYVQIQMYGMYQMSLIPHESSQFQYNLFYETLRSYGAEKCEHRFHPAGLSIYARTDIELASALVSTFFGKPKKDA